MKTFKFEEPLVLKLMNGDVLSVKYLGEAEEGWLIVKSIADDATPQDSELYIQPSNLAWVAKRRSEVDVGLVDTELFDSQWVIDGDRP